MMVQLVRASLAFETVEGLHPHLHITTSAHLRLSTQAHPLHPDIHWVSDGEPQVLEYHNEAEEVGDGHEDDHGDVVPLDYRGHCEDGVS